MAINFLDQPANGNNQSKQGLFSALGGILSNVAVGLQSPQALAELEQRKAEAEQQFRQYLSEQKLKQQAQEIDKAGIIAGLTKSGITPTNNQSPNNISIPGLGQFNQQTPEQQGKPIFTIGPDGNLMQLGSVPKGSQVVTNPQAPTADMRNSLVNANQASSLISELKSQAENLQGGYKGMGQDVLATINRGTGKSADYFLYRDSLPSAAVAFYRGVTGDTRLSDADAKARALPLLWHTSESEDLRTKKFDFLQKMISARQNLLQSGKYQDGVIPLDVLKKEASKSDVAQESQKFTVNGKIYNIPSDKIDAFKKDMGIK